MRIVAALPYMAALSAADFRVAVLVVEASASGVFSPSNELWASAGLNRSAAIRSLASLVEAGLLTKTGRGSYRLNSGLCCAAQLWGGESRAAQQSPADDSAPKSLIWPEVKCQSCAAQHSGAEVWCDISFIDIDLREDITIRTSPEPKQETAPNLKDQTAKPSRRARTPVSDSKARPLSVASSDVPAVDEPPAGPTTGQLDLFDAGRAVPEPEPKAKKETAAERKARVAKEPPAAELIEWAKWWNDLAQRRVVKGEVLIPPRLEIRVAWDIAQACPDLRAILIPENRPVLEQRLAESGAYQSGWWTFAKFLGARTGDRLTWKLTQLFDGGYDFGGARRTMAQIPIVTNRGTVSRRLAAAGIR